MTLTNPETGRDLPTVIWFLADVSEVDASGAPYAALVFAPGFFASPLMYPGNGQQLATWGYIVAMPDVPDERIGGRVSDACYLLTYLGKANAEPGSTLYGMIDTGRLEMVGHSLGGLTALVAASRDERIKAVVAPDPVNPPVFLGVDLWDMEGEDPGIKAPTLVIGAPSQTCNYYGNYEEIYPVVGAHHKAKLVVSEGNHAASQGPIAAGRRGGARRGDRTPSEVPETCNVVLEDHRVAVVARFVRMWRWPLLGVAGGSARGGLPEARGTNGGAPDGGSQ